VTTNGVDQIGDSTLRNAILLTVFLVY